MGKDNETGTYTFVEKDDATAKLMSPNKRPITIIGNDEIRNSFEAGCLAQISNIADAPGVDEVVLNPDGHQGYGCPVGSVFASRDYIYPNSVGPDVKCSMSFLQLNIPAEAIDDKKLRREIINALEERIPLGPGGHFGQKARKIDPLTLIDVATLGAQGPVLEALGIPAEWEELCEDAFHGKQSDLLERLERIEKVAPAIKDKLTQLGGVGGGNHFMECNEVKVKPGMEKIAETFGLIDGNCGFLNHFGSRGFGFMLTEGGRGWDGQFRHLASKFEKWHIPFPGGDKHNVYAPVGSPECTNYLNDMALGANFATVNHLLVCTYVLEAFQEVMGNSVKGELVYYIAHNIIRREVIDKTPTYVHRKGATRALWGGHHELKGTRFESTGHPILLPGNPVDGSTIMVAQRGSRKALNSVNHGAGRSMSRRKAKDSFTQKAVDSQFINADILTNCRVYPIDECSGSYKPYAPVIDSVERAGLAKTVASLRPRMLIKDSDERRETSA